MDEGKYMYKQNDFDTLVTTLNLASYDMTIDVYRNRTITGVGDVHLRASGLDKRTDINFEISSGKKGSGLIYDDLGIYVMNTFISTIKENCDSDHKISAFVASSDDHELALNLMEICKKRSEFYEGFGFELKYGHVHTTVGDVEPVKEGFVFDQFPVYVSLSEFKKY